LQLGAFLIRDDQRRDGWHAAAPHAASLSSPPYVRN